MQAHGVTLPSIAEALTTSQKVMLKLKCYLMKDTSKMNGQNYIALTPSSVICTHVFASVSVCDDGT